MTNTKKIEVKELYFSYDNTPVLEGVNISVEKNEIVTIVGPNGGGKTTLLKLILGLLTPDKGEILIDGKNNLSARGKVGYVSQHLEHDDKFPISVYEVILSGRMKAFGFYSAKDKSQVYKAAEETGVLEHLKKPFSRLSGGLKQRTLIARCLVSDMGILLLDEPTANIDSDGGEKVHSLLKKLSEKVTIILVTHDTGFVSSITDRVLCINKSVKEHPIDEHFSDIVASSYESGSKIVRHQTDLGACK